MSTPEYLGPVPERLARLHYDTDHESGHIEVHQEVARGPLGKILVALCPAHVFREEADGTISAEYAACFECGTCLSIAPNAVTWHYPRGGTGVNLREG